MFGCSNTILCIYTHWTRFSWCAYALKINSEHRTLVLPNNKSQTQQLSAWQREFRYLRANSYIQGACFIFFWSRELHQSLIFLPCVRWDLLDFLWVTYRSPDQSSTQSAVNLLCALQWVNADAADSLGSVSWREAERCGLQARRTFSSLSPAPDNMTHKL